MAPTFEFESQLWRQGLKNIAGIDEVGRGALAGPLTTAAVVFPPFFESEFLSQINDSKLVKPQERIKLATLIKQSALFWSIASTGVSFINKHGIVKATFKAMRSSIVRLPACEHLLIDAFYIPHFKNFKKHQTPIVKGDQLSLSIAAASIIAKVHRDRLMKTLSKKFPHYAWGQNKGYGTQKHKLALKEIGPCSHHRTLYIRKLLP